LIFEAAKAHGPLLWECVLNLMSVGTLPARPFRNWISAPRKHPKSDKYYIFNLYYVMIYIFGSDSVSALVSIIVSVIVSVSVSVLV